MNRTYTAKYSDYLVSLIGACILAFGLGAALGASLGNLGWVFVLLGAGLHALGMSRIRANH
jgi:hypothetical protein